MNSTALNVDPVNGDPVAVAESGTTLTWVTAYLESEPPTGATETASSELDPIIEMRSDPLFSWRSLFPWAAIPYTMGAPEFAPFIRDVIVDPPPPGGVGEDDDEDSEEPVDIEAAQDCFSRRPELAHMCLERADADFALMRRAPECPDEFACPNEGCV